VADEGQPVDDLQAAGERAAKNTAVRAAGEIVGKLGSFVLFAVLARETGPVGIGVYVFALAWGEVAMTPVGLGIDRYMLRAIAGDRSTLDGYFWNAFVLKVLRGIPIVLLSTLLVVLLFDWSGDKRWAVVAVSVGFLFDTLARTLMSVFNAFERAELVASMIVVERLLAAGLGLLALGLGYGVVAVGMAFATGALVKLLMSFYLLSSRLGMPKLALPADFRRDLRAKSLPYTTEDIFGLVLSRVDVLMLSALATGAVVGFYGSAYRLIDATTFVNVAIAGAFTAMFTYLGPDTTPTLQAVYQRALKLAMTLLLPIAVAFAVVPHVLCRAFFGDSLAAAGDPLRLLAPVVVLFPLIVQSTNLVLSRENPMKVVRVVATVAVINVVANAVLIPLMEAEGAALAMLISELIYLALALRLALPLTGGVHWRSMLPAPLLAGAAMALVLWALAGTLVIALAAGVVVYAAVYAAIDAVVAPGELRFVVGLVTSRFGGRRAAEAGSR
jgi:O-antigen/teichoic acid export membrane protein